jgi:glycosyltransferase involved in cell wall biosynthesis
MRLISIVEATSVTGPLKPLLMFSSLSRSNPGQHPELVHRLITTRRSATVGAAIDPLGTAAQQAGLEFITIPERYAGDYAVLGAMKRALREFRPDLIETHDSKSHFLLLLMRAMSRELRRVPWAAFHHGYTTVSARVRFYQHLDRISLRFATRINTLCQPFARQLAANGARPERIAVLTNTVAPRSPPSQAEIDALRSALGAGAGDLLILSVGRLSSEKGHINLLNAVLALPQELRQRLRIVFAGDGPERESLTTAALPLGDRVIFAGHLPDAWHHYHASDVFVLPSYSEGSPLVMFEAMAAGKPIIASRVGGIPEVLEDGRTAVLVEPGSVPALTEALARAATDKGLRESLGTAAQLELRQYEPDSYAIRLWGIYQSALAPTREVSS